MKQKTVTKFKQLGSYNKQRLVTCSKPLEPIKKLTLPPVFEIPNQRCLIQTCAYCNREMFLIGGQTVFDLNWYHKACYDSMTKNKKEVLNKTTSTNITKQHQNTMFEKKSSFKFSTKLVEQRVNLTEEPDQTVSRLQNQNRYMINHQTI